ncbi:hypothetical protein, partial [Nocardia cyriacigeorgica]|uniref:hypothetical protein n=1 Tax=Nocardia cyriacigeorgica TaxID=135487 RepID=UPI0024541669
MRRNLRPQPVVGARRRVAILAAFIAGGLREHLTEDARQTRGGAPPAPPRGGGGGGGGGGEKWKNGPKAGTARGGGAAGGRGAPHA